MDPAFNWQPGRFAQWSPDGSRILFDVSVGEYGHPAVGLYGFDIGSYRLQQVVDPLESTSVASGSAESVGLDMHFDVSPTAPGSSTPRAVTLMGKTTR